MKGFAKVDKQSAFLAITGYGFRYDLATEIFEKAIDLYYEKHFVNGSWWNRFFGKNKTKKQFARSHIPSFDTWDSVLHEVLDRKELDELHWWCYTSERKTKNLKALYNVADAEYILVDEEMASFINEYKKWLEEWDDLF